MPRMLTNNSLCLFMIIILHSSLFAKSSEKDSVYAKLVSKYNNSSNITNVNAKVLNYIEIVKIMEDYGIKAVHDNSVDDIMIIVKMNLVDSIFTDSICNVLDDIGLEYRNNGYYSRSLKFHNWALDISKNVHNPDMISIIYNNIGVVYRRLDDYQTALSYHLMALSIAEEYGNIESQAVAINSIGNIQMLIGNLDESLNYFKKSLAIEQKHNNLLGIAINLNNIGNIYNEKSNLTQALEYYNLSLDVNNEIKSAKGIAISYNDIGSVYSELGDYKKALIYYHDAFIINLNSKDKHGLAYSYYRLGELYTKMHMYDSALVYLKPGLKLSLQIGTKAFTKDIYYSLYEINRERKKYELAFDYLKLSDQYHDSIININVQKNIVRMEVKFETERKENHIAMLERNAEIADIDIKKQKTINLLMLIAFVMVLGMVVFLLHYLINKNKTNKLLLERNEIIEKAKIELDSYAQKLLKAKQDADKNNEAKSEFLANISHEIRTPLNSVIGFADLLSKSLKNTQHLNYLHSIQSSGRILLMLINDVLDLSKIEAGKYEVNYSEIIPKDVFQDISRVFLHKLLENNIKLIINIDKTLPQKIVFNDLRLRQILFNIVGNAIKFTENGEVAVSVVTEENAGGDTITMKIDVVDTGVGISANELENIFDPFTQSGDYKKMLGTGLGLSITKSIVELMNGRIDVTSQEGKGSRFSIVFNEVHVVEKSLCDENVVYNSTLQIDALEKNLKDSGKFGLNTIVISFSEKARSDLDAIYSNYFEQAYKTKMSLHIAIFISNLKKFGRDNDIPEFVKYCSELNSKLTLFDIDGIEMMLEKFNEYYKTL